MFTCDICGMNYPHHISSVYVHEPIDLVDLEQIDNVLVPPRIQKITVRTRIWKTINGVKSACSLCSFEDDRENLLDYILRGLRGMMPWLDVVQEESDGVPRLLIDEDYTLTLAPTFSMPKRRGVSAIVGTPFGVKAVDLFSRSLAFDRGFVVGEEALAPLDNSEISVSVEWVVRTIGYLGMMPREMRNHPMMIRPAPDGRYARAILFGPE